MLDTNHLVCSFHLLHPILACGHSDRCLMRRGESDSTFRLETGYISLFRGLFGLEQMCRSFNAEQDVRRTLTTLVPGMQCDPLEFLAWFPNEERSVMAEQAFSFHPRHRGCHHSRAHRQLRCLVQSSTVAFSALFSSSWALNIPRTRSSTKLVFGHLSMQQLPSLLSWLAALALTLVIVFPASGPSPRLCLPIVISHPYACRPCPSATKQAAAADAKLTFSPRLLR